MNKYRRRRYFKNLELLIFNITEQIAMVKTISLRKISLTTIVAVLTVVTMSSTVFSTAATTPVAFGQRIVTDLEQSVTTTTNGIYQNNNATDRHTSSLRITQSPETGLDIECGGDLKCEILDNNTIVATNEDNTTANIITDTPNALNQSLTQSLNQSSIPPLPLLPFGDNDFDDMLNNDFGIFSGQEDLDSELDSEIDEWIDRMLNGTLGDLQAPLQTPPDLRSVSV